MKHMRIAILIVTACLVTAWSSAGQAQAVFTYDPSTGDLFVDVQNGQVESSILIEIAQPNVVAGDTSDFPLFASLVNAWSYQYFNGKMQFVDGTIAIGGTPLVSGSRLDLGDLLPNLSLTDFATVEYGSDLGTQFTTVQLVPEPSSLLLLLCGNVLLCCRRSRRA